MAYTYDVTSRLSTSKVDVESTTWYYRFDGNGNLVEMTPNGQADKAGFQEFARFVHYAEQVITLPLPDTLPRPELLQRLHYATHGVVGNLMNLLRYAAWLTRQHHQEMITLPTLATAFDKRLIKHLKSKTNPFTAPPGEPWMTTPIPKAEESAEPSCTKRQRRASAAEVLQAR